jgi:hypothetical protein
MKCRSGSIAMSLLVAACFEPVVASDADTDAMSGTTAGSEGDDAGPSSADSTGGQDGGPGTGGGTTGITTAPDTGSDSSGRCGDGVVDSDEECDEGDDNDDNGACLSDCTLATCGDGFVHVGVEACDGTVDNGECNDDCTAIDSCDEGFADCDGMVGTGCEVDLLQDALHCGFCSHDCIDASCDAGLCEPNVLADGLDPVQEIAFNATYVFVSTNTGCCTGGAVSRIPKSGGGATAISTGLNMPRSMVPNGSSLIWASSNIGDFFTVPIAGGSSVLLQDISGSVRDVVRNANHIFYVKSGGLNAVPAVARFPIGGGNLLGFEGSGYATAIDIDNARAFWIRSASIRQSGLDGSNVIILAEGLSDPRDIAAGGNGHVYWTEGNGVRVAEVDDGNAAVLADLGVATERIVMQGGILYVGTNNGEVHRVLPEDGSSDQLAGVGSSILGLQADADRIYFATSGTVYSVAH